ncbi:hypothetical protein BU17DRAFT_67062 [Hysterangium stoloniferum]|nr:hypothetical protein BU17DRAFT_67062 [Hysterangium stoloniferum]
MSRYDPNVVTSPGQLSAAIGSPRSTYRSTRATRTEKTTRPSRRHERAPSEEPPYQPPQRGLEVPNVPEIRVTSPPLASPNEEPAMLPGGGLEIPPNFQAETTYDGHYRPQSADIRIGEPDPSQLFGRMFRGLRRLPAAVVKAGRSYGPRQDTGQDQPAEPEPEMQQQQGSSILVGSPEQVSGHFPPRSDVETYIEPDEDDDVPREHMAQEYNQQRRLRRDRMFNRRTVRDRFIPPPQPVPVPGSSTPVPSQVGHSQVTYTDANFPSLQSRLEAEEQRQEFETRSEAQATERPRRVYAADVVRPPPSSIASADQQYLSPPFSNASRTSEPLPPRVYSQWAAPAHPRGPRIENHRDEPLPSSPFSAMARLYRQIRDMPWVGERVAADYVPGARKPARDPYDTLYPPPDSAFSSPLSQQSGLPLPVNLSSVPPLPRSKPGRSWYNVQDSIVRTEDGVDFLALPDGVPPPPGFVRYPYPIPEGARAIFHPGYLRGSGGRGAQSVTTYTQTDSRTPLPGPPASQTQGRGRSASGFGSAYTNSQAYSHYIPAEASPFGESYVYVPGMDGRHLQVGSEAGRQPGSVYSQSIAQSGIPESLRP